MTALTYRGVSTAGDANGSTLTVNKVAGTAVGDHLWLLAYLETALASGTPSVTGSWTSVQTASNTGPTPDFEAFLWCRIADAGDVSGSSYTISWDGDSIWRSGAVVAYSGGHASTLQDATATTNAGGSDASAVAPGLTPATGDAEVLYFETDYDGRAVTPPTGTTPAFTERTDFGNLEIASGPLATAGATGDKTGALTGGASYWTAFLAASRPAVAGGAAQDTPELYGRPHGLRGHQQMRQLLAQ